MNIPTNREFNLELLHEEIANLNIEGFRGVSYNGKNLRIHFNAPVHDGRVYLVVNNHDKAMLCTRQQEAITEELKATQHPVFTSEAPTLEDIVDYLRAQRDS